MAINFPSSPSEGQAFNVSPGKSFVFRSGAWRKAPMTTAMPKNYLVNPAMQISQQNTAEVIGGFTVTTYPADQWFLDWKLSGYSSMLKPTSTRYHTGNTTYGGHYIIDFAMNYESPP